MSLMELSDIRDNSSVHGFVKSRRARSLTGKVLQPTTKTLSFTQYSETTSNKDKKAMVSLGSSKADASGPDAFTYLKSFIVDDSIPKRLSVPFGSTQVLSKRKSSPSKIDMPVTPKSSMKKKDSERNIKRSLSFSNNDKSICGRYVTDMELIR